MTPYFGYIISQKLDKAQRAEIVVALMFTRVFRKPRGDES